MKLVYFIWSMVERFGANAVSLAGNILLSYLLLPADFGMVTMLSVFTALVFVFIDCGMGDGLLRMKEPTRKDFNTVFFFNLTVGVFICLLYIILAPWVAQFFGYHELREVMMALGLGAVFSGLTITQITKLRSRLQFRRLAGLNVAAVSLALLVALAMALWGYGYWALVELQVGFPGFYFLLLLLFSKWEVRLEFDVARFKELWLFGVNLLVSTIFVQLAQNVFTFLLGKFYSPVQAGYMGQAQKLQQTPTNSLEMSISSTSFVLIAKSETQEQKRTRILNMFGVMTFVNALFCVLLFSLSYPIIDFVFPEKWLPVVPYFRMLLCWGLVYPVCSFMLIIFKTYGKTDLIRNITIAEKSAIVLAAYLLYPYGVITMLASAIVVNLCSLGAYMWFASRLTSLPYKTFWTLYLRNMLPLLIIGALTWAASTALLPHSLVALIVGVVLYFALTLLVCRYGFKDYYDFVVLKWKSLRLRSK